MSGRGSPEPRIALVPNISFMTKSQLGSGCSLDKQNLYERSFRQAGDQVSFCIHRSSTSESVPNGPVSKTYLPPHDGIEVG